MKNKAIEAIAKMDDAVLGKAVKKAVEELHEYCTTNDKLHTMSAAMLLCAIASDANADRLKINVGNMTFHGKPGGSWEVTIKKLSSPSPK